MTAVAQRQSAYYLRAYLRNARALTLMRIVIAPVRCRVDASTRPHASHPPPLYPPSPCLRVLFFLANFSGPTGCPSFCLLSFLLVPSTLQLDSGESCLACDRCSLQYMINELFQAMPQPAASCPGTGLPAWSEREGDGEGLCQIMLCRKKDAPRSAVAPLDGAGENRSIFAARRAYCVVPFVRPRAHRGRSCSARRQLAENVYWLRR